MQRDALLGSDLLNSATIDRLRSRINDERQTENAGCKGRFGGQSEQDRVQQGVHDFRDAKQPFGVGYNR
jgi:hypothetical protein